MLVHGDPRACDPKLVFRNCDSGHVAPIFVHGGENLPLFLIGQVDPAVVLRSARVVGDPSTDHRVSSVSERDQLRYERTNGRTEAGLFQLTKELRHGAVYVGDVLAHI